MTFSKGLPPAGMAIVAGAGGGTNGRVYTLPAPTHLTRPGSVTRPVSARGNLRSRGHDKQPKIKMGREYSVEFRGKAVGMVLAGMDRKAVCKRLGISRTQLYVWLKREKAGEGLKSKPGVAGNPPCTQWSSG